MAWDLIGLFGVLAVAGGQTARLLRCQWRVLPCFLLSEKSIRESVPSEDDDKGEDPMDDEAREKETALLNRSVVVDFGGSMRHWKDRAAGYEDLSPTGDGFEACQKIQPLLEWAKQLPEAEWILAPYTLKRKPDDQKNKSGNDFIATVEQRLRSEADGRDPYQGLNDLPVELPPKQNLSLL